MCQLNTKIDEQILKMNDIKGVKSTLMHKTIFWEVLNETIVGFKENISYYFTMRLFNQLDTIKFLNI